MNLVFAYGSLINRMELEKTLKEKHSEKDYVVVGIGRIEDYKLAFTRNSKKWKGGVLDVIISPCDYVLGLVIEISSEGMSAIDKREGVNTGAYAKETVSVKVEGKLVEATIYTVVNKDLINILPSRQYVNKVVVAMRNEEFPESYILKYLLEQKLDINEAFKETVLNTLRYLRMQEHAVDIATIENLTSVKRVDIAKLINYLIKGGYIRQDRRDIVDKYDFKAKYYTFPGKREEINRMLLGI